MTIGDKVKVKDLKVGTFYILLDNGAIYLSVYLGLALKGSYKVYYFYNAVALMGEYPRIYPTQTLDLQNQINYVFSKQLEHGCIRIFPNSLLSKVYDFPNAFYADIENWYMKNRFLDKELPELNFDIKNINEIIDTRIVKKPVRNTLYAKTKSEYYLYLGYDSSNKVHKMLEYRLKYLFYFICYREVTNLPKLYTVEQMYLDKQITDKEKRLIETRDYKKDILECGLENNLFVDT